MPGSRIAHLILVSNLAGLFVVIPGALLLSEFRSELMRAHAESQRSRAVLIASVVADRAAGPPTRPALLDDIALYVVANLSLPANTRVLLFDPAANLIGDSLELTGLPRQNDPASTEKSLLDHILTPITENLYQRLWRVDSVLPVTGLDDEIANALRGRIAGSRRPSSLAPHIISVTVPVRRAGVIVGALTVESGNVDAIIATRRAALAPLFVVAIVVAILITLFLTIAIARPLRTLAQASDRVGAGDSHHLNLPSLTKRHDEIGRLATSLTAMTTSLADRAEANARFASDVAHELKNPLTSIRSALETGHAINDPAIKTRMDQIIEKDVQRMNRLITDISAAGRLEAESARHPKKPVNIYRLLADLIDAMMLTRTDTQAQVILQTRMKPDDCVVDGLEDLLVQLVRNLIENARSFLGPDDQVSVHLQQGDPGMVRILVDDTGPGIRPDRLEKIFERFYSDRESPTGNHSGLGLSIAHQIARTHGGTVTAQNRTSPQSNRVIGARLVVDLPLAEQK